MTPLFLLLLAVSCAPRITPPLHPQNPVPVVIADYGRHTSILLPSEEVGGGLIEYAWGDYDWFAANRTSPGNAVAALFWSDGSALGVRWLPDGPDCPDLCQHLHAGRLLRFNADRDKVESLRARLTTRVDHGLDTMIYNGQCGMFFVRDDEHYELFHNCNHLTADWLRDLGCEVDGVVLLSNFELVEEPGSTRRNEGTK